MFNVQKLSGWTGKNKARVRLYKAYLIRQFIKQRTLTMLSFPGIDAKLERMLLQQKLLSASNLVAIQTYERLSDVNIGRTIFNPFENTMEKYFSSAHIWPYSFESFSKHYTYDGCTIPSASRIAKWRKRPYWKHMKNICSDATIDFNVLDIDLCGIFNRSNSTAILRLFENEVVKNKGLLFITHQKGRDVRGGKLFDLLHGYLSNTEIIDYPSLVDDSNFHDTDFARNCLIPLYYQAKLYDLGYLLKLDRIAEYRDRDDKKPAVTILQYIFKWELIMNEDTNNIVSALEDVMNGAYSKVMLID